MQGYVEKELFSFIDYISSGFELNFMVAVDYTGKLYFLFHSIMWRIYLNNIFLLNTPLVGDLGSSVKNLSFCASFKWKSSKLRLFALH